MQSARWWLSSLIILAAASAAQAQRPSPEPRVRGWTLGAGGSLVAGRFGSDHLTLGGPTLQLSRLAPRGIGFDVGLVYLVPTGRYHFNGAALDLGVGYGVPVGPRSLLLLRAGATGVVGGDSDGSGGGAGAFSPGAALVTPIAGRLGLRLDLMPRIWASHNLSEVTIGGAVSLVLLPR